VGGAVVPLLFGLVADASTLRWAFVLPVLCYAYILWYGISGHKTQAA
jgi:MFS transporter, FHS family, L-fucose permease